MSRVFFNLAIYFSVHDPFQCIAPISITGPDGFPSGPVEFYIGFSVIQAAVPSSMANCASYFAVKLSFTGRMITAAMMPRIAMT